MSEQTDQMQGIGVAGIDLQDLLVEQFGLMKIACLVKLQTLLQHLRHGLHRRTSLDNTSRLSASAMRSKTPCQSPQAVWRKSLIGRIPGTVFAAQEPAPVRHQRQGDPDRHAERPGHVSRGRVRADDEVEVLHDRGRVHEVSAGQVEPGAQIDDRKSPAELCQLFRIPAPSAS